MNALKLIALLPLSAGLPAGAVEVVLDYEAEALTVVGTPFGLTIPRLTVVTGTFVYDTADATDLNGSPERGHYQLSDRGGFSATFQDADSHPHTLTGSVAPWLEVENILPSGGGPTIDTFRFWDGDTSDSKGGIMSLDGTADDANYLRFTITDSTGAAFPDDTLPAPFPMTGIATMPGEPFPHTFEIGDGNGFPDQNDGKMLLQFKWLLPRSDDAPVVTASGFDDGDFRIEFTSRHGEACSIEFSADLVDWDPIGTEVPATGSSTTFRDVDAAERLGALPDAAYYRVRRE